MHHIRRETKGSGRAKHYPGEHIESRARGRLLKTAMQVEARMSMYGSPAGGVLEQDVPKAHQACLSCRKQKRKCNKALPACALCERMGRLCDYSEITPAPTSDDFNALRQKLLELERRLNTNNGVPMDGQPYMSTPAASTVVSGAVDSVGATPNTVYIQHDPAYQNIQNRFPSIAFLDSEAFQYGQVVVPKPAVDIPVVSFLAGRLEGYD